MTKMKGIFTIKIFNHGAIRVLGALLVCMLFAIQTTPATADCKIKSETTTSSSCSYFDGNSYVDQTDHSSLNCVIGSCEYLMDSDGTLHSVGITATRVIVPMDMVNKKTAQYKLE